MRTRSVSIYGKSLCLALIYSLLLTSLAPFAVSRVEAAPRSSVTPPAISNPVKKGRKRSGELLVRFRENASNEDKTAVAESKGGHRDKNLLGNSHVEKLKFQEGQDVDALAAELRLNPAVELVEPNYLIERDEATPDDPRFSEQWALKNTGATGGQPGADLNVTTAWETTTGAPSTVIAVVDSGIDFSHPDLKNNRWVNQAEKVNNRDDDGNGLTDDLYGWDWVTGTGTIRDEQGHGTIVAGIIAAQGNNQMGTTGVMWRASLMSLRVLDNTGTGDVADAVEAIDYAVEHGAQVINCSWGMDDESDILKDAIDRAGKKGVVVVTSAGNDTRDLEATPYYPASYELSNLISVASTDQFDHLTSFTNYGAARVTIAAPGTDILTTQMGGGYRSVTGTSASAPLVSGVAGLVKTLRPWLTAAGTRAAIIDGARHVDSLSGQVSTGGVVNASGSLASLRGPDNLPTGSGNSAGNGGNANGNNGNNGNGNGAQQQPPPTLPPSGRGAGGTSSDGGFSRTPPPQTTGAPATDLPNLDQIRKLKSNLPTSSGTIRANLPCTDCDPSGGGGGGGSYYPPSDPMFSTARTRPQNDTGSPGVDLGSQNFNWSLPLLVLKGRAGLDLSLTLYYNSLVWTKDGSMIKYNADHGTPAPGFHLGMPFIQQRYYNSDVGIYAYMMVTPSGGRVEMRQVGTSTTYESSDGSYTQMIDYTTSALVRTKEGTQYIFEPVNNEFRCTRIEDRNGNYISIGYDGYGRIGTITDTLGRVINFNYSTDQNLSTITQTWKRDGSQGQVTETHTWATFNYDSLYMVPNFSGLYVNGPYYSYQTVLTSVTIGDGTAYGFDYTQFGQVWKIRSLRADASLQNYVAYNLPGSSYLASSTQPDCPRFSERHEWADTWNGNNEVITSYSVAGDGSWSQETQPDGTIYKEYFYTSGWQNGLTYQTEVWSGGVRKKWTTIAWTQDDPNLSYQTNPRPSEMNVYDEAGNRRRTTIDYTSYSLPSNVREYATDGVTVVRRTETQYRPDTEFISRHILNVVWMELVYDGESALRSKINFHHDRTDFYNGQAPSVGHDTANYGTGFFGRANVSGILRYNVTAPDDPNQAVWVKQINYNLAGEPVLIRDAQDHQVQISYTDSYSDSNNSRNTLAYPTTVTDGDGYSSTTQYNYDMGVETRAQNPKGAFETFAYDAAGRIEQVTNPFNNAHTRWVYPASGETITYTTLKAGAPEAMTMTYLDGAGRLRAKGGDNPSSTGGYYGQFWLYDTMGHVAQYSKNPTEINGSWAAAGDDAAGWAWTYQNYDWKGRPLVTWNPGDGSTTENSYTGCGCAGGEQVTTRDERGRRKRMTMDSVGRLKQVDELNWDGSVYSTSTYSYNSIDQISEINQAGRVRTFDYDGFGRLWHRTTPEQGTTTYSYNADDTISTVTDARGATSTLLYNNRHLVTSVIYGAPSGVAATTNVSFGYDAAGNRTSMTDGLGTVSYVYNTISQLTSETRTIGGLGSYSLTYGYELGGQLSSITNPWGAQASYSYDQMGRVTGITGSGYVGISTYASNLQYRAWGDIKQMTYGNNLQFSAGYDSRQRLSQWKVTTVSNQGVLGYNYSYNNFYENTGRVTYAQNLYDPTLDRSYDYDHLGRMVSTHSGKEARWHIQAESYSGADGPYSQDRGYDQWGNVTHRVGWGGWQGTGVDETLSYNSKNQLATNPATGAAMQYDASGNLINDGYQSYQYDVTGQQTFASGAALYQGYDGNGMRVKKTENGATTYYLRSSVLGGQVIAEIDGGGNWQRGYVYLGSQLIALQSGGVYWVHADPIAKSQRMTDSSGNVASWIEVDPWGGEVSGRSANSALQPHKYTSYERDGNGGDDAMFRRYEGRWNRFSQPDPSDGSYDVTNPQSFNRYAYVQNDPVNLVDPNGLDPDDPTFGLGPPPPPPGGTHHEDPGHSGSGDDSGDYEDYGASDTWAPFWDDFPRDEPIYRVPVVREPGRPVPVDLNHPLQKKTKDPNDPYCKRLAQRIANLQSDIISHASALIHNNLGLPDTTSSGAVGESIEGHRDRLIKEAQILQDRIQEYRDNCGGGNPPTVPPANAPRSYRSQSTNYPPGTFPRILIPIGVGVAATLCLLFWEVCVPVAAGGAAVAP